MNPTIAVGLVGLTSTLVIGGMLWIERADNKTLTENATKFETALATSQASLQKLIANATIAVEEKKALNNDLKESQSLNAQYQATIFTWQRKADFEVYTRPLQAGEDASDLLLDGLCRLYDAASGSENDTDSLCATRGTDVRDATTSLSPGDTILRQDVGDDEI